MKKLLLLLTALACSINTELQAGGLLSVMEAHLKVALTPLCIDSNGVTNAIDKATGRMFFIRPSKREVYEEYEEGSGLFKRRMLTQTHDSLASLSGEWIMHEVATVDGSEFVFKNIDG